MSPIGPRRRSPVRVLAQGVRLPGGRTLALVEKGEGRVAFYALPDGRRIDSVAARSRTRSSPTLPAASALENDRIAIVDIARWAIVGDFATGAAPDTAVVV